MAVYYNNNDSEQYKGNRQWKMGKVQRDEIHHTMRIYQTLLRYYYLRY